MKHEQRDIPEETEKMVAKKYNKKMQCPQNCKHSSLFVAFDSEIEMDCEIEKTMHAENWKEFCRNCDKWELEQ